MKKSTVTSSKRGRPEVYTMPRLEKIVGMVKAGKTAKAALNSINSKNGLKGKTALKYVPMLVAMARNGISLRAIIRKVKGTK